MEQIPPYHEQVDKDGYQLTFYPGFVRQADVRVAGQDPVVLYRQEKPYDIRGKPDQPFKRFMLQLKGGPNDRNVTFHIDDPDHSIAEITVKLYPRGREPGGVRDGGGDEPNEVVIVVDDTVFCPPVC